MTESRIESADASTALKAVAYTDQIARGIHARHLATPISEALTLRADMPSQDAIRCLGQRQFDQAPVMDNGDRIMGVAHLEDLRVGGSVGDLMVPLHLCSLVSADVGLPDVLEYLQEERFLLVVDRRRVEALITPADLGRPASRTFYYLLLAQLEIALGAWVRQTFIDQEDALALLASRRQRTLNRLLEDLRKEDSLIDVVATLSLKDLLRIAGHDASVRRRYFGQNSSWDELIKDLEGFRNQVMHPVRDFREATPAGMRVLLEQTGRLQSLVQGSLHLLRSA